MSNGYNRRNFLKSATAVGMAAGAVGLSGSATAAKSRPQTHPPIDTLPPVGKKVRVGYVGIGNQGSGHVRNLIRIPNAEIVAVCDKVEAKTARAQKWCIAAGQPKPVAYNNGEEDYKRMCDRDDIDLVYTATPWALHVPVMVAAMEAGKHACTEVPAAVTIDECWQMVETSERTRKHCIQMENCNYDRVELMILNMVRKGLLGDLLHAEGGYRHDLRGLKLSEGGYQDDWRLQHSIKRNGDLYPTHGLGPLAQCMEINYGDAFDYLVSAASPSRGLNLFAAKKYGPDSKKATQKYALGDVVTTTIRTKRGRTIVITHDTNTPRPYSRDVLVQGDKGIVRKYPQGRIHIEGVSKGHGWEDLSDYFEKWDHPLWKYMQEQAKGAGHGGMDYIEDYRLIEALRHGTRPDTDVYDAAALSAVCELSERSIANRSNSVDFPDFTRGLWKTRPALGIIEK